jgi:hypothetical protein
LAATEDETCEYEVNAYQNLQQEEYESILLQAFDEEDDEVITASLLELTPSAPEYSDLVKQVEEDIAKLPPVKQKNKGDSQSQSFGREESYSSYPDLDNSGTFWNDVGNNNVHPPSKESLLLLKAFLVEDADNVKMNLEEGNLEYTACYHLETNGFVYRKPEGEFLDKRLYIPRSASKIWSQIIQLYHDDPWNGGHHGLSKTLNKIKRNYYWLGMDKDVTNHCHKCLECQRNTPITRRHHLPSAHPRPNHCFEVIAVDEKVGLPLTDRGNESVWVFVDHLSRMVILEPAPRDTSAEQLVAMLQTKVTSKWGTPRKVVSDQGTQFTSRIWEAFQTLSGSKVKLASTGNPKTAGLAERAIKQTLESLRKFIDSMKGSHTKDWDLMIPSVEFAFNDSVNARTGFTPFEVAHGRSPRRPIESMVNAQFPLDSPKRGDEWPHYEKGLTTSQIPADYVEDYFMRYHKIQLEAKQTFNESAKKELANRRKKFAYATPFREGQWVLYSQLPIKDGTIKIPALLPRKIGPFKVKEARKGTYVLDVESCVNENDREVVRSVQTRDRGVNGELLVPFREIPVNSDWENDVLDDELNLVDGNRTPTSDIIALITKNKRSNNETIKVLDIFSGTKSLFKALNHNFKGVRVEYTSIDWDEKFNPTHCFDICDWKKYIETLPESERKKFQPGYFDIIWVSPDCSPRTAANTVGTRDLVLSEKQIEAAASLVDLLKPRVTLMENPESSPYQLRDTSFIKSIEKKLGITPYSTTYCCYGYGYKKMTTIWSSVPLDLYHCHSTPCPAFKKFGHHLFTAQSGTSKSGTPGTPKLQVYQVPELLLTYILLQSLLFLLGFDAGVAPKL